MPFLLSSHLSIASYSLCPFFPISPVWVSAVSIAEAWLSNRLTHAPLPISFFSLFVAFQASIFQNPDYNLLFLFFSTSLHLLFSSRPHVLLDSVDKGHLSQCYGAQLFECVCEHRSGCLGEHYTLKGPEDKADRGPAIKLNRAEDLFVLLSLQNTFLLKSALLWLQEDPRLCYQELQMNLAGRFWQTWILILEDALKIRIYTVSKLLLRVLYIFNNRFLTIILETKCKVGFSHQKTSYVIAFSCISAK